jgi:hypothetical protein
MDNVIGVVKVKMASGELVPIVQHVYPLGDMLLIRLVGKSKTITGNTSILALITQCPDADVPGTRVCATR